MTSATASPAATSITTAFTDPDPFWRSVRSAQMRVVTVGSGKFSGELTRINFGRIQMQRAHETLARIGWVGIDRSRAPIRFQTQPNQASVSDCGIDLTPDTIVFASSGATYHSRTSGESYMGAMSLGVEDLAAAGRALVGCEITTPAVTQYLRPDPKHMSRLLYLHAGAGRLAKISPDVLAHPEVSRALEQQLLHAMVQCLSDGNPVEKSTSHRRHTTIMARLEDLLMANAQRPLHLAEICVTLGISERTLRLCGQEMLGMGPIQYLWLRRMDLARRALVRADRATTTVTAIATDHGFWELGRFAVAYRTLFGESPSTTLARSPVDLSMRVERPFPIATSRTP